MAISKIILNGVTQMDLTNDTVAANNLLSPNTAHDAAGLPVVGTATAGEDIPVITMLWNSQWTSTTITCNKTFAECKAKYNTEYNYTAEVIEIAENNPSSLTGYPADIYAVTTPSGELERICFTAFANNKPLYEILYYSDGTLEKLSSPTARATLNATENNTYYAPSNKVYTQVNVNVPTGTARTSADLSASGATVTAPAGLYAAAATYTIASGSEGTPTATKGTVSNHAVTVTPSVTNTAGYISGGTHSGTGVSVSASELVSGTYTVDSSGTKDVTNYASASISAGTAGTPSAAKGTVSNHSVTVTPSVTNTTGWITGGTKSGTAVTVSASELVSGNRSIVDNGTNIDVTNYATVSVAVPFSAITVSTSSPSGGNNGDVWIQTS